jgi:hypothetical protein
MTENIEQFGTVRIPAGIPDSDVPAGALATVLDVYTDPYLAYEIEVVDADGRTLYVGVVDPSWVELVESYGHGDR